MMDVARMRRIALLGSAAVLVPILIFGGASWRAPRSPEEHAWERWTSLSHEQQREYVQQFHKLMARGDSSELLRRAAAFAALPQETQQRLGELSRLRQKFMSDLSPAERSYLQGLAPEARAFEILRRLRARDPETLPDSTRDLLAHR